MFEEERVAFGTVHAAVLKINEDHRLLPGFAVNDLALTTNYEGAALVNGGNVAPLPAFIRQEQVFTLVQAE